MLVGPFAFGFAFGFAFVVGGRPFVVGGALLGTSVVGGKVVGDSVVVGTAVVVTVVVVGAVVVVGRVVVGTAVVVGGVVVVVVGGTRTITSSAWPATARPVTRTAPAQITAAAFVRLVILLVGEVAISE